jgi:hypothetical protein
MSLSQCLQTLLLTFHVNELGPPMYRVSEGIRSTHGQDGAVVLDIREGRFLRLNRSGSMIFQLIERAQTQSQIVATLVQECGVCWEVAQADVIKFLRSLEQLGLIYQPPAECGHA